MVNDQQEVERTEDGCIMKRSGYVMFRDITFKANSLKPLCLNVNSEPAELAPLPKQVKNVVAPSVITTLSCFNPKWVSIPLC